MHVLTHQAIIIIVCVHPQCTHPSNEASFYRDVIVYVLLVASILGLVAIILMKTLEIWQSRRNSTCEDAEPQTATPGTVYGVQNGKVLVKHHRRSMLHA